MTGQRGRPVRPGIRRWVNDETVVPTVAAIMARRDQSNEETLTEAADAIELFARTVLPDGAFTKLRRDYLRRLVLHAKPSVVSRTLLCWQNDLPDRTIRRVQQRTDLNNIAVFCWAGVDTRYTSSNSVHRSGLHSDPGGARALRPSPLA